MFETTLFLAFPISVVYESLLNQVPAAELAMFISRDDSSYLQRVEHEGVEYLGKSLGSFTEMGTLEMSSAHVYSLLKKLIPEFSYGAHPLVLLGLARP